MITVSDTQRRILLAASAHPETDVREHMRHLKSSAIVNKVVESMLKHGLVMEDPNAEGVAYIIADAGYAAIGMAKPEASGDDNADEPEAAAAELEPNAPASKPKRAGTSKKQTMIDLLSREEGTTHQQLMEATGWQKHSVHGAKATLNKELIEKRGLIIVGTKDEQTGKLIYKITKHEPAKEAELVE